MKLKDRLREQTEMSQQTQRNKEMRKQGSKLRQQKANAEEWVREFIPTLPQQMEYEAANGNDRLRIKFRNNCYEDQLKMDLLEEWAKTNEFITTRAGYGGFIFVIQW